MQRDQTLILTQLPCDIPIQISYFIPDRRKDIAFLSFLSRSSFAKSDVLQQVSSPIWNGRRGGGTPIGPRWAWSDHELCRWETGGGGAPHHYHHHHHHHYPLNENLIIIINISILRWWLCTARMTRGTRWSLPSASTLGGCLEPLRGPERVCWEEVEVFPYLDKFFNILLISIGGLVSQTQSGHMEVRKVVEDGLLHLGTIQDLRRRFCVSCPFDYFFLWFSGLSIVQLPPRHCSLFME